MPLLRTASTLAVTSDAYPKAERRNDLQDSQHQTGGDHHSSVQIKVPSAKLFSHVLYLPSASYAVIVSGSVLSGTI